MTSNSLIQLPQVRKADFSGYVLDIVAPLLALATGSGLAVHGSEGQFQLKSGSSLGGSILGQYGEKIGYGTTSPTHDFHISGKNIKINGTGYFDSLYIADSYVATEYVLSVTGAYLNDLISSQSGYNFSTYYPRGNPSGYVRSSETGILISSGLVESSYYLRSNPSGYITTGQTGSFATTGWVESYYYPRTNPSGYVKASETGILLNRSETGALASSGWASSLFYPRSNPSGWITENYAVQVTTGNYSITAEDKVVVFNRGAGITGTLPAAVGSGKGYILKNINSGTATITGDGSNTIDGESSFALNQWDSIFIIDYLNIGWIIV